MMKKLAVVMIAVFTVMMIVSPVMAKKIKIGLSLSDSETERWDKERMLMEKLATEAGATLIYQGANHDAKLQNDQINNMITQGVDVLIVIAEDGAAAATAVEEAHKDGIPTIAYDRLIKTDKLAAYLTFDNVEVGRSQARGILAKVSKGNFITLGGNPTDNNAHLFRQGQMEVLQPLIDKGDIKIVANDWVDRWDPAVATQKMENMLTAIDNKVDAVVASNDGTALGALQAMKAQGLAGKVPISGQDATSAGCNSIVNGELTMTVFKDIRLLSPMAIDLAIRLANGEKPEGMTSYELAVLTGDKKAKGSVDCKFLEVVGVDMDNVYDVVVKSGFQSYDEVYRGVAEDKKPARP